MLQHQTFSKLILKGKFSTSFGLDFVLYKNGNDNDIIEVLKFKKTNRSANVMKGNIGLPNK
jgi:hypothetical protein